MSRGQTLRSLAGDGSGRARWALVAVCALAALARFPTLGVQSPWEDEAVTRWLMHRGLGQLLATVDHTESTPPLFYVLEWACSQLAGSGELALRLISALAGTATAGLAYLLGRECFSVRAGLLAGLLVAVSPDLVWYSQEARAYALYVAFATAGVLLCLRADAGRPRALALWTGVSGLALWTHYFAVFLVGLELLWLTIRLGPRRLAGPTLAIGVASVGLLPLALAQHAAGGAGYLAGLALSERIGQLATEFTVGPPAPDPPGWPLVVLGAALLVGLVAILRAAAPVRRRAALLAGAALAAVALPVALDVGGLHVFDERNTMDVVPLVVVALAGALTIPEQRGAGPLAAVAVLGSLAAVTLGAWFDPARQREDWRSAAMALGEAARPRALVVAPVTSNPAPVPALVGFTGTPAASAVPMPATGAAVAEIDVLDIRAVPWFDGDTPAAALPPSPARGFRLGAVIERSNFRLFRFYSPLARRVRPEALRDQPLLPRSPDVMVAFQVPVGHPGP